MIREDFIKRTIRQLVEAAARILGLSKSGRKELAQQQLEQLYLDCLGMPREAFAALAPESLSMILGDRTSIAIELLRTEAELRLSEGQTGDAKELMERVEVLKQE